MRRLVLLALVPTLACAKAGSPAPQATAMDPTSCPPAVQSSPTADTTDVCPDAAASEPVTLGYVASESPGPGSPELPEPTAEQISSAERTRLLGTHPAMRQALADVTRLGIVSEYHEDRPGILVLALGGGYGTSASAEYNLLQLHRAYEAAHHHDIPATLELWLDGEMVGSVTRDGLRKATESAAH
jgi:hypothetical protein